MMNSKELLEIIRSRRAVTPPIYNDEEITKEELDMVLESANWAPTHKKTEPGRFKILQGKAIERFSEFMVKDYAENIAPENPSKLKIRKIREKCAKSNKIILICYKKSGLVPEWEEIASTATGVQNMWLMCTALKIGSYWSSPKTILRMNEFIPLGENENCIGIFYMGKVNEVPFKGVRFPIEEKVQFIEE